MSDSDWRAELERRFDGLPLDDQILLIERLLRRIRHRSFCDPEEFAREMEAMANDPDMQREWKPVPGRPDASASSEPEVA